MLALAIISTILVCIQPIPSTNRLTSGETFLVVCNLTVTIATIWILYAHIA